MPLDAGSVGAATAPRTQLVDARWSMAFAAALDDRRPEYLDTRRPDGLVAHPLFPVAFEWPVFLETHGLAANAGLGADERRRGVHASHDLLLHRPLRPGQELTTVARIAGVASRRAGAYQVVRLDTTDGAGRPVSTTWYGSLYRGVAVRGDDRPAGDRPPVPAAPTPGPPEAELSLPVAWNLAHVYSECARIWNPIHTDPSVAERAGLPGLILHGTCTLALAVSALLRHAPAGPEHAVRVSARFSAMVAMPSTIRVRLQGRTPTPEGEGLHFEVLDEAGAPAVRAGFLALRS